MILNNRDIQVLLCLAEYYLLSRSQLQRLCFPSDKDGRITRRRLNALAKEGLIQRHYTRVASQYDDPPGPVYLLAVEGCRFLAAEMDDRRFLWKPVKLPHALHLQHQLAITELHLILKAAVKSQRAITLAAWYNEFEVINANEDPEKHFGLFTEIQGRPRRICAPDAAFMLDNRGEREVFYVEMDRGKGNRGTNTKNLVQKSRGYAELAEQELHRRHFPGTRGFAVLLIAPGEERRDALLRAFAKKNPGLYRTDLWRFAAMKEINARTMLHGKVFYRCTDLTCKWRLMAVSH